ncbi:sensor histidine kinase [Brachybacterium aquaticum]|uniref:histidine kinase n=1 Tax=Brachybacterium aquaticum TaxID=1432564 RepID=A0A841AHE6_9MICO|nr:histidine kinase [Brachybacterium aquaticum]MBB5832468.1 signal transduction histidine kinase [Brachybacterium aquaticum]
MSSSPAARGAADAAGIADAPHAPDAPAGVAAEVADGAPPPWRRDVVVAGVYALLVMGIAQLGIQNSGFLLDSGGWGTRTSIALMLVASASVVWRRRAPLVPFLVAGPLAVAEIIAGGQISAYFLLFEALFAPVMHGSARLARRCSVLSVAAGAAAILAALIAGLPGPVVLVVVMLAVLTVSTPLLWAWEVRHHREARQAAERLAGVEHELAASRSARAVEAERRTIAHDLHDVIAGHLSAVSLHTSLAASLEDPDARDRSLVTARESSQAALRDLRSMIGVLTEDTSGTLPSATLDWPSLGARLRGRDPGARVEIDPAVSAVGADGVPRVEPSVQAALLRIGAEAVTNAVRHGAAPSALEVRVEGDAVRLELVNGLPESRSRRVREGEAGSGLGRGAIEARARAVGGTARSGIVIEASGAERWEAIAELPVRGPAGAAAGVRTDGDPDGRAAPATAPVTAPGPVPTPEETSR